MARDGTRDAGLPPSRRAKVYNRTRIIVSFVSAGVTLLYLAALIITGASRSLGGWAHSSTPSPFAALLLFCLVAGTGQLALTLPLGFFAGFVIEHRYGLSNQSFGRWTVEHLKALAVGIPVAACGIVVVYGCIGRFGELWWIPVGALLTFWSVLLARLAPVLLFPLFYTFTPLGHGPVNDRITRLCATAGIPFKGIFTFNLSKNTKKANAGFAGIGRSKRIILADTLTRDFTEEEIESVFAHELGHYVHHHIVIGLITGTVSVFAGLFITSILYTWSLRSAGFTSPTDFAALPLLAIWLSLFGLATSPLGNALSRRHERQADRYAVQTTGNPDAFISALRKLADTNLADPDPHPAVEFLLYSHPAIARRIRAAAEGGRQ